MTVGCELSIAGGCADADAEVEAFELDPNGCLGLPIGHVERSRQVVLVHLVLVRGEELSETQPRTCLLCRGQNTSRILPALPSNSGIAKQPALSSSLYIPEYKYIECMSVI